MVDRRFIYDLTQDEVDAQMFVRNIAMTALLIDQQALDAILSKFNTADALMPVIDPTGYRDLSANKDRWQKLIRAFIEFRTAAQEMRDAQPKPDWFKDGENHEKNP